MKKRDYLLFVGLLFLLGCTRKKNLTNTVVTTDSLAMYFAKANDNKFSQKARIAFNQKALAIVTGQQKDSLYIKNLFKLADIYYNMQAMEDYKNISKLIEQKAIISNDSANLAKAYRFLGDYYRSQSINDSAYLYYFKAEKGYMTLNDKENVGRMYLNKAYIQYNEGDLLGCETSGFKALEFFRDIKDKEIVYEAYNTLGIVFNELHEYDKAIEYHMKALDIVDRNKISSTIQPKATSINNLGVVYRNMNKNKEATFYFKEGLKEEGLYVEKLSVYAMLLDNLAYSQFKLKNNSQLPTLFYKSLSIRDSLQIIPGIVINKLHLSEYYAEQKDRAKAVQLAQEAYTVAKHKGVDAKDVLLSLKQLLAVHPAEASLYWSEYITISDSIQHAERKIRDKLGCITFETEELVIEKEKLAEQNKMIMLWSGILVFIGSLLSVIGYQHFKNKKLQLKEEQRKVNEEIYTLLLSQQSKIEEVRQAEKKRIAQELHDGILGRLFGVRMFLDGLNKKEGEQAIESRASYILELQDIERDLREISHHLNREKDMVINNFVAIMEDLIEEQRSIMDISITFNPDFSIQWEVESNLIKINLYRIVQESFQNINKYAQAKNIAITIGRTAMGLQLTIEDDGVGFDMSRKTKGIGLQNMKSRAASMGGILEVTSVKGKGTKIEVIIR